MQSVSGLGNVDVRYGETIGDELRPAAYVMLDGEIETEQEYMGFMSSAKLTLGFNVQYQPEETFLNNLDALVATIDANGYTACGVEFLWVSGIKWESINKDVSKAEITVSTRYST